MKSLFAVLVFAKIVVGEPSTQQEYYNILALEGDGLESLVAAYILEKAERHANEYCEETNCEMPEYSGHDQRKALKDLFNMTAGVSSSAFIAAGIST
jgi:hypothetical protein